jgi:hypothetical protein
MTLTANGYLAESFVSIRAAVANLSAAQLEFKPSNDSWSIREILEHLVLAGDLTLGPIQQLLESAPPSPEPAPAAEVDAFILAAFPNRAHKAASPPFLIPTATANIAELLERLQTQQAQIEKLLENESWHRARRIEGEPIQAASQGKYRTLDGVQWLLVAAAHIARHTSQILEIKTDPRYPR